MIFFLFSFLISNQFYQVDTIINSFLASFVSWTTNIMNYFFPWIPDLLQSQTLHLIILGLCCLTVCPQPYCVFILWTFLKTKLSLPDYFLLNIFGWNDAWVMIFFLLWISHLIACDIYLSLIGDGLTWLFCCFFLPSSIWYQRIYKKVRFTEGNTKGNRKVVSEI